MPTYSEVFSTCGIPPIIMHSNRISTEEQNTTKSKIFIKSYDYRPQQFIFHKLNKNDDLFLGVEIEIDCGGFSQEHAKRVLEIMNEETETVYCVHDGSLTDGFEIVTHPCTYGFHKTLPYQKLFEELTELGYRAHDTTSCGLHVHINRDFFGKDKLSQDLKIGNLLYIFEKFWDEVSIISRRRDNRFASRVYLEDSDSILDLYAKTKSKDKYCAINLKHESSVEIRVFRGTLNVETFYSTLEFVCLMAELANSTSIYEIQMVTWSGIVNMFSEQLMEYYESRKKKSKEETKTSYCNSIRASSLYATSPLLGTQRGWDLSNEHVNVSLQADTITVSVNNPVDTLKRKISRMKKQINRCRNELEKMSFRRILNAMQKDLKRLRSDPNYVSEYI